MATESGRAAQVVMLGSGGWMATQDRGTSSMLVRQGTEAVLLDAGTGVGRLCRQPDLLDGVGHMAVVLSHFHLDHVAGLTYLPAIAERLAISVWAPGRLLGHGSTQEVLGRLVGAPFLPVDLEQFTAGTFELREGRNEVLSWPMTARIQPFHPGGSVALRLDDELAYCTDTAPDPDSAEFVSGVRVLVHEAWSPASPTQEHSSAASAARTAAEAGVGRLVLSHVHPLNDDPAALLQAARSGFAATEVGHDGLRIS